MSEFVRRRTAAVLLAVSLGLVGAAEAQAGSRIIDPAPRQSVAIRLQEMVRGLLNGALGTLTSVTGGTHMPGHADKPPGQTNARDGAGLDPHGNNNNRP